MIPIYLCKHRGPCVICGAQPNDMCPFLVIIKNILQAQSVLQGITHIEAKSWIGHQQKIGDP